MISKWLSFRTLSIALALVLLVTAALKLHLLLTDPFADIKIGTSLPLLWLAVFAEAGAVWIVFSNFPDQIQWLSLVSLFGVMTAVSVFNVLTGKSSCGCAGAIEIQPAWFLALNIAVIAMLLAIKPNLFEDWKTVPLTTIGQFVGFAIVAIAFVLFQTPIARSMVRSKLLGHDVEALPFQLGTVDFTDKLNCKLQLRNHSGIARKITGIGRSCVCIVPEEVAHTSIPGYGTLDVAVYIRPKNAGPFHQRILFYLDSPEQYVVAADLFGYFEGD